MENSIVVKIAPKIYILILVLLFLPAFSFAGQFKVTRVYDGDTLTARGHDIDIKVRLVGIDAPETSKKKRDPGQPYSQQSKKHLAALVLNKSVDVKGYGQDRYGRILALVTCNGKNVNLEMVMAGLAEVYRGKHAPGFDLEPYLLAEHKAYSEERGMWSLGEKYISPRDWRKTYNGK